MTRDGRWLSCGCVVRIALAGTMTGDERHSLFAFPHVWRNTGKSPVKSCYGDEWNSIEFYLRYASNGNDMSYVFSMISSEIMRSVEITISIMKRIDVKLTIKWLFVSRCAIVDGNLIKFALGRQRNPAAFVINVSCLVAWQTVRCMAVGTLGAFRT